MARKRHEDGVRRHKTLSHSLPGRNDKALARVAIIRDRSLSPGAKAVADRLIDHFNWTTGQCNPSISRLEEGTGCSRRTVYKALRRLEEAGYIRRFRHGGQGFTNAYAINWALLREIAKPGDTTGATRDTPAGAGKRTGSGAREGTQTPERTLEDEPLKRRSMESGRGMKANHPAPRPIPSGSKRSLPSSSQVLRNKALQRWEQDLKRKLGDRYPEAVNMMTEALIVAATDREIRQLHEGYLVVLDALEAGGKEGP